MSTINQARAGKGFRRSESWRFRTFAALLLASTLAFAGSVAAQSGHWVGTWATSPGEPAAPYEDTTLRQIVYVSIGGDQIRVRGYLAGYTSAGGSRRGTSTTRTDTGDGACETIYVEHFNIVEAATSYWRISMWASLALLLTGLVIHFRRPYRPY